MWLDLATSLRSLRRRPSLVTAAVATLALGIGAATTMFALVQSVLLAPLPYAESDRLVAVWTRKFFANREIDLLRRRTRTLDEVAAFSPGWLMALTDVDVPQQVNAGRLSANLFRIAGIKPMLGTPFGPEAETPGQEMTVVLGHALWREAFGGDSGIVGRSVTLNGDRYTVAAVMPRGFQLFDWESDLWYPLTTGRDEMTWSGATAFVYGRLARGSTVSAAHAELRSVAAEIQAELSLPSNWSEGAQVTALHDDVTGRSRRTLWLLFGGVVCLLLIATANVANLLLVRAAERRPEIAVRSALGASSARIARLLLTESAALAFTGGTIGVALAALAVRSLPRLLPPDMPRIGEIGISPPAVGFALAATVLPMLAVALAPILQVTRGGAGPGLRDARGARSGERLRGTIVAAEVALALVLMIGAALMGRTVVSLLTVDVGMRRDNLLTARVQPTGMASAEETRAFWREALARVEALPGVLSAGTILHLPTSGRSWSAVLEIEGRPRPVGAPPQRVAWQVVSPGYLATAGVPLESGRTFDERDRDGAPLVAVVNDAFARTLFPGESPLGRRIRAGRATGNELATIVGVVGGVRHDSLNAPPRPEIYVPLGQRMVGAMSLVVRTRTDPAGMAPSVRSAIWSVSRNVAVSDMRSMSALLSASIGRTRLILATLGFFAAAGLLLGAVGIYGVVAYGVQQRLREIGIRAALGADARALRVLIVTDGVRFAVLGVLVGAPIAVALSRLVRGLVFGVSPTDPVSFAVAPAVLIAVAAASSWVPARRASRTDPATVLRSE